MKGFPAWQAKVSAQWYRAQAMSIVTHAYRPKRALRKKRRQPALAQTIVSPAPMKKGPGLGVHPTIVTTKRRRRSPFPEAEDFDAEEHRCRAELARQIWRDLVRAATGQPG